MKKYLAHQSITLLRPREPNSTPLLPPLHSPPTLPCAIADARRGEPTGSSSRAPPNSLPPPPNPPAGARSLILLLLCSCRRRGRTPSFSLDWKE
ncbi:hypothetical protein DAI22_02g357650 [Oryza sativa Japonica Group]|nr:hypothetical protein DAI22_02g357650 [Oryza sativa Japonica Group]